MTAYNLEDVIKSVLIKEAYRLVKAGWLTQEAWAQLKTTHSTLKQNTQWYIRILFFLLGSLLVAVSFGFLALFIFVGNGIKNHDESAFCVIGLIASIIAAELIASSKYYAHGLSDAFILSIQIMTFFTVAVMNDFEMMWLPFFILSSCAFYCYKRFIHRISLLISVLSMIATIIVIFINLGTVTTLLLPFLLMFISASLFYTTKTWGQKTTNLLLCKDLYVLYYLSFILFYLSSNYFIIQEASNELLYSGDSGNRDIMFSYFFEACSYLLPIGYIALGLWWRDRIVLWIGIVVGIVGVFTFRYYHHLLPTEIVLTLSGVLLLSVSLFLIKKLKNNTEGFTFQKDPTQDSFTALDLEVLQASLKNISSSIQPSTSTDFNGGSSSGGGASGSY